jgi:spermidine synthase
MMAHVPMLAHPSPDDTLVICFGMGTTYRSAIAHGGRVTVVELVQEVFDAFDWFYPDSQRVRHYPKGRMVTNDGRNFLKITRDRYDVITLDPPPPIDAAGVGSLYSSEFIELAKSRLKPGGIMAHWIPYPGTNSGVDDDDMHRMLVDTFTGAFTHVLLIPSFRGVGLHVLGSMDAPIEIKRGKLARRLKNSKVAEDLNEWDEVPMRAFMQRSPVTRPEAGGSLETDDTPWLEFNLIRSLRRGTRKVHPDVPW